MAQQDEGWPLGLQPLNVRVGSSTSNYLSGSVSFNTLLNGSPISSTDSSSDLDTESTGSFFHDKSITLGSLIGVSSILKLSKRSLKFRNSEEANSKDRKKRCNKSRTTWLFSLCSRYTTDAAVVDVNNNHPLSLGHFLRGSGNEHRTDQSLNNLVLAPPSAERNSLFVHGCVGPPRISLCDGSDMESRRNGGRVVVDDGDGDGDHGNGYKVHVLFPCMRAQPSH